MPHYLKAEARRRTPLIPPPPQIPLLYVPSHPGREFHADLGRAKIAKWTPDAKADFHSLRTTFCTLVIESGANLKEAMSLVRHTTPELIANVYARTRLDRLQGLAKKVGEVMGPSEKCAPSVLEASIGQE